MRDIASLVCWERAPSAICVAWITSCSFLVDGLMDFTSYVNMSQNATSLRHFHAVAGCFSHTLRFQKSAMKWLYIKKSATEVPIPQSNCGRLTNHWHQSLKDLWSTSLFSSSSIKSRNFEPFTQITEQVEARQAQTHVCTKQIQVAAFAASILEKLQWSKWS